MTKRNRALRTSISKYNEHCVKLKRLHQSEWGIPLPQQLPTKFVDLKECPSLMEDVWITPIPGNPPMWLEDSNVRNGIRAMLKIDRCYEERRRLGNEADNLCRWFGRELCAVELALRENTSGLYSSIKHKTSTETEYCV